MYSTESRQVLLHCCCAPCASAIIEWMLAHNVRPTLYYCNPNIYPDEEYSIRKNECSKYASELGLQIIDEDYDHQSWLNYVAGHESEPERGSRCLLCFKKRLLSAARKAVELGFTEFTTTLASSRWKSLEQINEAGRWAAEKVMAETGRTLHFDERNWRKGGLQQRRNELLKEKGFYNQLYCGCEFSLEAMRHRFLPEVDSTNNYVLDTLARGVELPDETVTYTFRQTAGRGQMGNAWESEADRNVTFSLLLRPEFLPIKDQFYISEICSLGILTAIEQIVRDNHHDSAALDFSIKWPNDIYAGDKKIAGILIENKLMGSVLTHSVLGVGINVGQEHWIGNAPNPVSLQLLGVKVTPKEVMDLAVQHIVTLYHRLRDAYCLQQGNTCSTNTDFGAAIESIHDFYKSRLYRKDGFYPYFDPVRNESFEARIVDVDKQGPLVLQLYSGEQRRYWFKEVKFVLPNGITKE